MNDSVSDAVLGFMQMLGNPDPVPVDILDQVEAEVTADCAGYLDRLDEACEAAGIPFPDNARSVGKAFYLARNRITPACELMDFFGPENPPILGKILYDEARTFGSFDLHDGELLR